MGNNLIDRKVKQGMTDGKINSIKKRYAQMGIKNRTLLLVSTVILISLLLYLGVFAGIFYERTNGDTAAYSQRILKNTVGYLDSYIDEISAIANASNYDYYLQNYLIKEASNPVRFSSFSGGTAMQEYEMSAKSFNTTINDRSDISSIMVFGKQGLLLYKSIYSYINVQRKYSDMPWYQGAVEHPDEPFLTGPQKHEFLRGNTEKTLSLTRRISSYEDGAFLGVILIDINLNEIARICDGIYSENGGRICILNDKGDLIYEQKTPHGLRYLSDEKNLEGLKRAISNNAQGNRIVGLSGADYQLVYSNMEKTGWKVLLLTPQASLAAQSREAMVFIVLAFLIMFIAVMLALKSILGRIVEPIIILKRHMDLADMGNLNIRMPIAREDEIGMLTRSFNQMLKRIDNLMGQVVEEQETKRKFEFQALQAQINPHFLYNTLESVIWMAETNNNKIVPMIEALAKLFRISLNSGREFISVEEEMEHVRNYLVIQSMRYQNKFEYVFEIADEVRKKQMLKLLVQPIVENSLYHGIKKKRGSGLIRISVGLEGEDIRIEVEDDGCGIDASVMKQLMEGGIQPKKSGGSGIGVRNVNERIKLYFGPDYGLSCTSEENQGTRMTIRLPGRVSGT